MTPRFFQSTVIANLTKQLVASSYFIPIVDDLTSRECDNMVLDFRGQPIPVALRIKKF